ncbi:hypothetical protein PENSPDRAFT_508043 [Peniophora sp. CONT]|nr:hypothetical protein PENSPDRAFT_508043 [Peniophora sp. CONT]
MKVASDTSARACAITLPCHSVTASLPSAPAVQRGGDAALFTERSLPNRACSPTGKRKLVAWLPTLLHSICGTQTPVDLCSLWPEHFIV